MPDPEPVVVATPGEPEPSPAPAPSGEEPAQPVIEAEPGTADKPPEPPEPGSEPTEAEKRIRQLVARQREAERQADYWRAVAEGKIKPPGAPQEEPEEKPPAAPKLEQFETYDAYEQANRQYLIDLAKHEFKQEAKVKERAAKEEAQQKRVDEINQKFLERIERAAETDPELLDIYRDQSLPVSPYMAAAIRIRESAPSLVRYLWDHKDEAQRIARLDPVSSVYEIALIEAKLASQPPAKKPPSKAPEPIKPVGTKGAPSPWDPEKAPMDEYVKRRNKEQYGRRT